MIALPRPQYVPQPEALVSALAWKILSVSPIDNTDGKQSDIPMVKDPQGKPIGLQFRTNKRGGGVVRIKEVAPQGKRLDTFATELERAGLHIAGPGTLLASAVLNSLEGVRVERSGNQPASPLTPAIALLQNMRGVLGTGSPPDTAAIIETMFALGSGGSRDSLAASRLWLQAANHRMAIDPLLNALDSAVNSSLLGTKYQSPEDLPFALATALDGNVSDYRDTPFQWFATAWSRLTSDAWVEALPARVWVDWATTILRLAIGLGYLWECSWHEELARAALQDTPPTWDELRSRVTGVLPWRSSRSGTVALDVAPQVISRIHRSERVRAVIATKLSGGENDFEADMATMCADDDLREALTKALTTDTETNSGGNLWEAIKYTLQTRDTGESNADYYGLLRSNGRYLTVSPGTEWVAVVASLSCGEPGAAADVSKVMSDLSKMGMRPELSDLIALLERAGMARGSADADEGVLVESAF